ncbi:MAG: hypothetical protein FJ014_18170 [Chloroflexi bacterium]|nr:hypothetical protein [Chloroflexota bacterium]
MNRISRITALFTMTVLLLVLALTLGAQAQPPEPVQRDPFNSDVVSISISPAEQEAALAFWTREAIAAAQPMEMLVQLGPAKVNEAALLEEEATGPLGFVAAGVAAPGADKEAQAAYPLDWAALEENLKETAVADLDPLGLTGTSQVYTSYTVNQWQPAQTIYPHKGVGRLSFSTPSGTSYCSATSISGNVMLTAAHCLYDTTSNRWYSRWAFTPAYRDGNAPYGTFLATTCWVLTAYVNLSGSVHCDTWARHDVGVCKMGKNSAGQTLNQAVGYMGRMWNYSYIRHFHNLGYPWRNYNNVLITDAGKYLRTCVAESFQRTTETRGMGCNWGPGISGGPWVIAYAPPLVSGYADGVNSCLFVGTQNIYAPRFNSNNIVPLCTTAGC